MFAAGKTAAVSSGGPPEDKFNYVTMLLHGDGTNGAQNNTFLDSSTNNFTITRNGNTTQGSFSPYGSNWSNFFDGSGDYLATSSTQIIPATTTYTVEAWVYLTGDYSDYREIVTQGSSGNANRWLMLVNITDGELKIQTGSSSIPTSFTVPKNTWTHLAFVNNGGSYTVYANGTSVGSGTNTVTPQNTYVTVGAFQSGAEYFQGYISNVRITNTAVYTSAFTPSTTPLTAISGTSFLTCQSNRFIDNSTNAYAITAYGNSSVQRFNPFGTSTAYSTSVIGGSGYFDGSGDNLTVPDSSAFDYGSGDFTLECWIYPTTTNSSVLLTAQTSTSNFGPCNLFFSSGALQLYSSSNNSSFDVANGASVGTPIVNQWSHVAVSRSGTSIRCFLNGTLTSTTTSSATLMDATGTFQIASRNGGEFYSGYISNFRVVKGTAVYTAAFTPPTAPLTAISGTSLLVNMTNGAIFDNAMMNNLETVGNAQISTSVVKYGTGSLYINGSGNALISAPSPNNILSDGDFTIEFWLYPSNTSAGYRALVSSENYSATAGGWSLYQNGTTIELWISSGNVFQYSSAITASTWQHLALSRASGTLRLFINGTQVTSVSNSTSLTGQQIWIGDNNAGSYFYEGYLDDLRITKGYARYTATFTPPTKALSDTGPI